MPAPGDLQEISVAIGRLQAEVEIDRDSRRVTFEKLEEIARNLGRLSTQLSQSLHEIAVLRSEIAVVRADVAAIKPEVELWRGLRNRAMGGLAVAGLMVSATGAALWETLAKLLRG